MIHDVFDVAIIGGGINGAGIARDCAMRGLKTILIEKDDLAQATSSASTKLIHGGLRYLEYYDFKLVRESLIERQRLLNIAPHIIWPLEFWLPHVPDVRPFWMIRLGLYLYDALSLSFRYPNTIGFSKTFSNRSPDLKKSAEKIISYNDCWVDDARLVVLNARCAAKHGATILTHSLCEDIEDKNDFWAIKIRKIRGQTQTIKARCVVNATGPWVHKILEKQNLIEEKTPRVRLVQGSHIIVPRYLLGDNAWILQQPDKRIIFAIPYENDFTLIGTTERDFLNDPSQAHISENETDYLIRAVNCSFKKQISRSDIRHTYSGVRPLFDDAKAESRSVTRDYRLYETSRGNKKIISIFGGKLTTYRHLSEQVTDKVCRYLSHHASCRTGEIPLPGGDIGDEKAGDFLSYLASKFSGYSLDHVRRLWQCYGTCAQDILQAPQGEDFGAGLSEAEIKYLVANEWAESSEDILFRRTKLGLHMSKEQIQNVADWIENYKLQEA